MSWKIVGITEDTPKNIQRKFERLFPSIKDLFHFFEEFYMDDGEMKPGLETWGRFARRQVQFHMKMHKNPEKLHKVWHRELSFIADHLGFANAVSRLKRDGYSIAHFQNAVIDEDVLFERYGGDKDFIACVKARDWSLL